MLIDSHCHLDYPFDGKTVDELIAEAKTQGVERFVTISTETKTMERVAEIGRKHTEVYFTIGVHPHDSKDLRHEDLPMMERLAREPKCVAIGEIGLDYHYDHSPREVQRAHLEVQLDLALKVGKPIVVHSREGEGDLLDALEPYAKKAKGVPGVIHCFSGTEPFGKKCIDLGFMLSFSGIVTFKKADEVRATALTTPEDHLLVETDAPFLAPIPYRGKTCQPWMVRLTAESLATLRGVSFEQIAQTTTQNAQKVFRF